MCFGQESIGSYEGGGYGLALNFKFNRFLRDPSGNPDQDVVMDARFDDEGRAFIAD